MVSPTPPAYVFPCDGPEMGRLKTSGYRLQGEVRPRLNRHPWRRMEVWVFVSNFVGGVVPGPVTEALEAARVWDR